MRAEHHIRSLTPVTGDWFVIHTPEDDRWFIDRVVAWALIEARNTVDRVMPITQNGMAHENDYGDSYVVFGEDQSHFGVSWKVVYDKTPPSPYIVREYTEHFKAKTGRKVSKAKREVRKDVVAPLRGLKRLG